MLSDAKLGHFEVITPQQYNGYSGVTPTGATGALAPGIFGTLFSKSQI